MFKNWGQPTESSHSTVRCSSLSGVHTSAVTRANRGGGEVAKSRSSDWAAGKL